MSVLGISRLNRWRNRTTNQSLLDRLGDTACISQKISFRRLEWLGHVARMPANRLPQQVFFSWLPKKRPFCGPRKRWKDVISDDFKKWKMPCDNTSWFTLAVERTQWQSTCRTSVLCQLSNPTTAASLHVCEVCQREFHSAAGLKRHKCLDERSKPLPEQTGSINCSKCNRWFASQGGFSVHKCISVEVEPDPAPASQSSQSSRSSVVLACCMHHCTSYHRCFKSASGFTRHNCLRLQPHQNIDRSTFEFVCTKCSRRLRRKQDLATHKC